MLDRQREQIGIRQLVVSEQVGEIDPAVVAQAHIVWPERVVEAGTDLGQLVAHRFESQWANIAVSRRIEHPPDTLLDQRTGCDFQAAPCEQRPRTVIEHMVIVKQRDPHVEIAQQPRCGIRRQARPSTRARAPK